MRKVTYKRALELQEDICQIAQDLTCSTTAGGPHAEVSMEEMKSKISWFLYRVDAEIINFLTEEK